MGSAIEFLKKGQAKLREKGALYPLIWLFKIFVYSERDTLLVTRPLVLFTKTMRESNVFEVREFGLADLEHATRYFEKKIPVYRETMEQGIFALGAYHRETGDIIGVNFYTPNDYYDHHVYKHLFVVPEGSIYQFAAEVADDYKQRSSVIISILNHAVIHWSGLGYKSFLSAVDVKNAVSMSTHFNGGYEEIGRGLRVHSLFNKVFCWSSPYQYSQNRFDALRQRYLVRLARTEKAKNASAGA